MNPGRNPSSVAVRFLALTYAFLLTSCAHKSAIYYPKLTERQIHGITRQIDEAVAMMDPNLNVGIKVVSLKTGEILYEKNSHNLFTPASNTKLFTAAAALHILGPYYRFDTNLYTDTTVASGTILGNLYLKGVGDPDLTDADLGELVDELRLLGIEFVSGDIVVDNSEFDSDARGPGWMWDEGSSWFFAPVDAMTLNDNCVTVHVTPGKNGNSPPIVQFDPPTNYVSAVVKATTVLTDNTQHSLEVERRWKTKENIIDVTGTIPASSQPKRYVLSIEKPPLYAGTVLKELLINAGINVAGEVRQDTLPSDAVMLASHMSPPVKESVTNFLKKSDNLTGELLLKKIGAVTDSSTGTWENGLKAIRSYLHDEVGIDTSRIVLADGSGVSRYNLVSAAQIVQLLTWVYDNFQMFAEFSSALPIAGADGTLKNRMLAMKVKAKTRAKTGTLQGVSSLSGYAVTLDNEIVAFSILMNGYVGSSSPYRQLQDRIVSLLTRFSRF